MTSETQTAKETQIKCYQLKMLLYYKGKTSINRQPIDERKYLKMIDNNIRGTQTNSSNNMNNLIKTGKGHDCALLKEGIEEAKSYITNPNTTNHQDTANQDYRGLSPFMFRWLSSIIPKVTHI